MFFTGGQSSANSNAARESTPEGSSPEEGDSDEKKRLQRMMRNRESASLSRERKKMQMAEKEKQLTDLQGQLNSVSGKLAKQTCADYEYVMSGTCSGTSQMESK